MQTRPGQPLRLIMAMVAAVLTFVPVVPMAGQEAPREAAEAGNGPAVGLESFRWLEGTWRRTSRRGHVDETWRILSDSTLEGESYSYNADLGERRLGESLLLVKMGGDIYYIPRPMENPYPVAFRLVSLDEHEAVFENPTHDFPTRITYRRDGQDAMTVTVEGPGETGQQRINFEFTRIE